MGLDNYILYAQNDTSSSYTIMLSAICNELGLKTTCIKGKYKVVYGETKQSLR